MDWNITKNSKRCLTCDKEFVAGDEFFSALYENKENFVRKDFCSPCWDESDKSSVFSCWKSKVVESTEAPKTIINTDMMLDLFFKLEPGVNDRSRLNLKYVLALFLIRKKVFKLKASKTGDAINILRLFYSKENRNLKLEYPQMTPEEISNTTSEVKVLLDSPDFILN